jgi:hypothetical protein
MILHLYTGYAGRTEIIFRGQVRRLVRLVRQIERTRPGQCRAVLSSESDYTDSQLAVLGAIADYESEQFLLALEGGQVPIPQ